LTVLITSLIICGACTPHKPPSEALENEDAPTTPFRGRGENGGSHGKPQPFRRSDNPLSTTKGTDTSHRDSDIQIYLFKAAAQTSALKFPQTENETSATPAPLQPLFKIINSPQDEIPTSILISEDILSTCSTPQANLKIDWNKVGKNEIGPFGTQQLLLTAHKISLCGEMDLRNSPFSVVTVVADEISLDGFTLRLPLKSKKSPALDFTLFRTETMTISGANRFEWSTSPEQDNIEESFHPPILYFSVSKEILKKSENSDLIFQHSPK